MQRKVHIIFSLYLLFCFSAGKVKQKEANLMGQGPAVFCREMNFQVQGRIEVWKKVRIWVKNKCRFREKISGK